MPKTETFDIENQANEVAVTHNNESSNLIAKFDIDQHFANASKSLFDLIKEQTWRSADGVLNAALGAGFVAMSTMEAVAENKEMMALHLGFGAILGAKVIRTIAEAGNSIYYRNNNVNDTAVEINLLKKLAEIDGKNIPSKRLIEAIDQALIRSKTEPLSAEVKESLLNDENYAKNFKDLSAKVSEINNLKLLTLTSILGVACAVAGVGAMIATDKDPTSSIITGAGLIASSISGASLNVATAQPKNISETILQAVKELNNQYFQDLQNDVEAGHELPETIETIRQNLGKEISNVQNPVSSQIIEASRGNQR